MKNNRSILVLSAAITSAFILTGTGVIATASDSSADNSARQFVAKYGEDQFSHQSADIVEAFPPGRSDAANDAILKKAPTITDSWKIQNKHYIYEGDHYAVQWVFESKWKDNGSVQRESTLAFGIVKDGKVVSWTEYYDDSIGELQHDHKMGTYTATEEPYPWPAKPGRARAYRAYDSTSATWKNFPVQK